MNNQEIAHLWANASRPAGKGSNLYFEGATIYSYGTHFPIARLFTHPETGKRAVLFTSNSYSLTTAKHKSLVRSACSHLDVYEVQNPRLPVDSTADLARLVAGNASAVARSAQEKKEITKARARAKRAQEKARREALEAFPQELKAWRAGGALPAALRQCLLQSTHLRLSACGRYVETSRSAKVPACVARKAWPLLSEAVAQENASPAASAWVPFFERPEWNWGDYRGIALRRVALGSPIYLRVGCHCIAWEEVEGIASALGLPVHAQEVAEVRA